MRLILNVIPAKLTGAQSPGLRSHARGAWRPFNGTSWRRAVSRLFEVTAWRVEIPAFAGMTGGRFARHLHFPLHLMFPANVSSCRIGSRIDRTMSATTAPMTMMIAGSSSARAVAVKESNSRSR